MDLTSENGRETGARAKQRRPWMITFIAVPILLISTLSIVARGYFYVQSVEEQSLSNLQLGLAAAIILVVGLVLVWGLWRMENWARSGVMLVLIMLGIVYAVNVLFDVSTEIFAGESVVPLTEIIKILLAGAAKIIVGGLVPGIILYVLMRYSWHFEETQGQRNFLNRTSRYILMASALSAIIVVGLIILFTFVESTEAINEIGLDNMLLGTIWRPGSIIGTDKGQFGLMPMIAGSILATFGAVILGVPLSIFTAILLAEVAPRAVREFVRPAVELLAGIPSVVYGLFGMVVLAPLIREIDIPRNTGFGLLNASIILAVMIIPTVTNIAEDALRAVPRSYKEGSLAMGATHWQTISNVMLPAARSGIIAAVVLGVGRALGETMAMIMVIGNSIAIPKPLTDNPLTLFLNTARTLTGNIAVEINYAAGAHRSALFFTGLLLFLMILLTNWLARFLIRDRMTT